MCDKSKTGTDLASKFIGSYAKDAEQALQAQDNLYQHLFRHKKLPEKGWSEQVVENFLRHLAVMDSNNFIGQVGAGEREGRVACPLVSRRHYGLSHGVGRSGDVTAVQPKAAGSSLANQLCNALVLDAVHIAGVRSCKSCFVVPTATGMALLLCLLYFKKQNPKGKYVIWSRIDQKTCFKCIHTAGLEPIVLDPVLCGDELGSDMEGLEKVVGSSEKDEILCCVTTTSCFAPRGPDKIEEVAQLCAKYNLPHLINNAYGLQASKSCHLLEEAARVGRVDAFVQSTDKNFMVPVGGAVIAGFNKHIIDSIAKTYPEVFVYLKEALQTVAGKYGERVLDSKSNQISLAMGLSNFDAKLAEGKSDLSVTELGSMLFKRYCTGARVVRKGETKTIEGFEFVGWGSSSKNYPCSYLNVAGAIGMTKNDVDLLMTRLDKTLAEFLKRIDGKQAVENCGQTEENNCDEDSKVIVI